MASRWWTFTVERFEPISHSLMILLFFSAHLVVFLTCLRPGASIRWPPTLLILLGTTIFFYKLRLYDEVKDYETDIRLNPTRPLARGLLQREDLHGAIALCVPLELLLFAVEGGGALVGAGIAISYSWLMYKEFFIREIIRPRLTAYAVSHTVVSSFLSLAILAALSSVYPWQLGKDSVLFALSSWCLFNVFEFGRKTFASGEERAGVQSYSRIFGRFVAVLLVLFMAGLSTYLLMSLPFPEGRLLMIYLVAVFGLLSFFGVLYASMDRSALGKTYRAMSSIYIVLVYLGLVIVHLIHLRETP